MPILKTDEGQTVVRFGAGDIQMHTTVNPRGLLFEQAPEPHPIGSGATCCQDSDPVCGHELDPASNHMRFEFVQIESIDVVIEMLTMLKARMVGAPGDEDELILEDV